MLLKAGMILVYYFKRQCIISNEFLTKQVLYEYILLASALFLDKLIS